MCRLFYDSRILQDILRYSNSIGSSILYTSTALGPQSQLSMSQNVYFSVMYIH
jgi:hypothetical protein